MQLIYLLIISITESLEYSSNKFIFSKLLLDKNDKISISKFFFLLIISDKFSDLILGILIF